MSCIRGCVPASSWLRSLSMPRPLARSCLAALEHTCNPAHAVLGFVLLAQCCAWVGRWLLPEGRKVCQPDGAHPTAVPAARRGRRALRFAAPGQQEAAADPAAATDGKILHNGVDISNSNMKGQRQVLVAPPPSGTTHQQQPAAAGAAAQTAAHAKAAAADAAVPAQQQAQQPVQPLAAGLPGEGHRGSAVDSRQHQEADAQQVFRQEAEEELGADEEGPAGASDEEAALERKSPANAAVSEYVQPTNAHGLNGCEELLHIGSLISATGD